jgi:hypothetical protein
MGKGPPGQSDQKKLGEHCPRMSASSVSLRAANPPSWLKNPQVWGWDLLANPKEDGWGCRKGRAIQARQGDGATRSTRKRRRDRTVIMHPLSPLVDQVTSLVVSGFWLGRHRGGKPLPLSHLLLRCFPVEPYPPSFPPSCASIAQPPSCLPLSHQRSIFVVTFLRIDSSYRG